MRRPQHRWLPSSLRPRAVLAALPLLLAVAARAETWVWVDGEGVTHVTDDASSIPEAFRARAVGGGSLRELWDGVVATGEAAPASAGGDRTSRLIGGAVADIERGETSRAAVVLESVLQSEPGRPEAHWYLAELDRQRGRYESAEKHLRAFLAHAGDGLEPWRADAERRLTALADERWLADASRARAGGDFREVESRHFHVRYDSELGQASPGYAATVLGHLARARESVGRRLGAVPSEPMGVVLYGKAAYLQAHRHRFSFQTVGFFDGRIHVVSAAHPAGELRDLLFHEYAHAVFREQTGGDRPFWLNEGLAELSERRGGSRDGLTRSERVALRVRIEEEDWIPLRRLAPNFSGLSDADARVAYLESTAAAAWIEAHTERSQRAQLLAALGRGIGADAALRVAVGLDTDGVDAAVRAAVLAEFPSISVPAGRPEDLD